MKKKQKDQLRQKTLDELKSELVKRQKSLVETRFKVAQRQLKDVHASAKARDEISFIKTIISEKTVAEEIKNSKTKKES